MRQRVRRAVLLAGLGLSVGAPAAVAQATGLPSYNAPYRAFATSEKGVGVSFPNGTDVAFEGFYGFGRGVWDVRFRGGVELGSGLNNDAFALFGAEFRTRVITHSESMPADGALVLGAGVSLGQSKELMLPIGVSFGRRIDIEDSDVSIVPYVQPTIIIVAGDLVGENVLFTMGLGGDFRLTPLFDLRVAVGFGDVDGFSLGAVWLR